MPAFTARGLEGETSANTAPMVESDDIAKYLADSDADEDAEATAASASAGEPSSSRTVPVEAVLEISSGGEEEFLVAPSRRITEGEEEKEKEEEEEQVQGAGAERREGRSKKKHDKLWRPPQGLVAVESRRAYGAL